MKTSNNQFLALLDLILCKIIKNCFYICFCLPHNMLNLQSDCMLLELCYVSYLIEFDIKILFLFSFFSTYHFFDSINLRFLIDKRLFKFL